jgi:cephalosporin hydroxylase
MVEEAKDGSLFIEVGSWKGQSASFMGVEIVNSGKLIDFWCVDTWAGSPELMVDPDVVAGTLQDVFLRNTKPVAGQIHALKEESVKAASILKDEVCDFVYIDADHSYEAVKADIEAWLPKVKVKGVLAGDDRTAGGVAEALAELLPEHEEEGVNWVWVKK